MEFSMKNFWDGSRRALARAITIVEDERDGWEDIMKEIYHHTGRAQVIGITGAPGAGKSTLSDALIKQYRKQESRHCGYRSDFSILRRCYPWRPYQNE